MKRIFILALAALSIPLLVAGCGGDGGDDAEGDIRATVERIATAETDADLEAVCAEDLSAKHIEEVYKGDLEQCAENPVNDDDELPEAGTLTATEVEVDGSTATVGVVTEGGIGGDGTWTMVEEDGSWKLDRIEDDFIRNQFQVAVENVPEGALAFDPMQKCLAPKIANLDAATLRRLTYLSARDDTEQGLDILNDLAEKCPRALSLYVADTLTNEVLADQGLSKKELACAERELVPLIELTGIAKNALNGNNQFGGATAAALTGLISGALKNCNAG